jgi:hypothetical protein
MRWFFVVATLNTVLVSVPIPATRRRQSCWYSSLSKCAPAQCCLASVCRLCSVPITMLHESVCPTLVKKLPAAVDPSSPLIRSSGHTCAPRQGYFVRFAVAVVVVLACWLGVNQYLDVSATKALRNQTPISVRRGIIRRYVSCVAVPFL